MWSIYVLIVFSISCVWGINIEKNNSTKLQSNRKGKFWGFGIVRFENSVCTASDGSIGTCYTRKQCKEIGGIGSGHCAGNIGTCCVLLNTCGDYSSLNNTYFVNTNFPNAVTSASSCSFTIKKCHPEICQVRIDFLNMNLAQPNANGTCSTDSLHIIGGASLIPPICGENSGSHVYVDFNGEEDIRLLIQTGISSLGRNWRFKIAQIDCECPTRAPSGCLQYYTGLTGTVMSFNYGQTVSSSNLPNGDPGTRQLANQNYGICVAMTPGYCSITWSPVSSDPYSFTVSNQTIWATGNATIGTPQVYQNGTNCTTDYIIIPNGSVDGVATGFDRYCGNGLPTITTSSKPFVLTVVTNGDEVGDAGNRGFSLSYTQQPCTTTMILCKR